MTREDQVMPFSLSNRPHSTPLILALCSRVSGQDLGTTKKTVLFSGRSLFPGLRSGAEPGLCYLPGTGGYMQCPPKHGVHLIFENDFILSDLY